MSASGRLHFPARIYIILENESPDIICWHPNNRAFRIVDHGRFEREIIPKYFRHNQISSVQRQLNLYGFKCVSRGDDKGSFYHEKFVRGNWEEAKKIRRSTQTQFGINSHLLPKNIDMSTGKFQVVIKEENNDMKSFPSKSPNTIPRDYYVPNSVASTNSKNFQLVQNIPAHYSLGFGDEEFSMDHLMNYLAMNNSISGMNAEYRTRVVENDLLDFDELFQR